MVDIHARRCRRTRVASRLSAVGGNTGVVEDCKSKTARTGSRVEVRAMTGSTIGGRVRVRGRLADRVYRVVVVVTGIAT